MTDPESLPPLAIEAASRFNASLRVSAISVVSVSAKHLGVAVDPDGLQLAFRVTRPPVQYLLLEDHLRVFVPLKVVIQAVDGDQQRHDLAPMEVGMLVVYQRIGDISTDDMACLPDFAGVAGSLHAWPYLRQEVQDLSVKLGFPALVLPPLAPGAAAQVKAMEIAVADVSSAAT